MQATLETPPVKNPKDKLIPWYFVAFFTVIAILDGIFVYVAITTQTGLVTENAYEKGLAFNQQLEQARTQPKLQESLSFENGLLRWQAINENATPVENATVTATIIRPVQDGYDFETTLDYQGAGVYEAKLDLPLKGLWKAEMNATWDNRHYQTSHSFTAP